MIRAWRKFSQIATLTRAYQKDGRNLLPGDLSILTDASVIFDKDKILWVGEDKKFPKEFPIAEEKSFRGKVLVPELVDSHTHLLFAGDRSLEYSQKLNGVSYQDIASKGGGILHTVKETRSLPGDQLFQLAVERLQAMQNLGVGTVEIKSGYALEYNKEKELSFIIERLKKHFLGKMQIRATYMAAHAVPKEFSNSQEYLQVVVLPLMEELAQAQVIDQVDIFQEEHYFNENDVRILFKRAQELNLGIKLHADEFTNLKGAELAVEFRAHSADHLLQVSDAGIKALAKSSTVATLLPGTGMFLGKAAAPGRKLLDAGAKVAMATDYNPGSCHCDNLMLLASLGAPLYHMNLAELWTAITLNAAHALGIKNQGAIQVGLAPRFSCFQADSLDQVTYAWGKNLAYSLL